MRAWMFECGRSGNQTLLFHQDFLGTPRAYRPDMSTLIRDLKYGIRTLAQSPGFTLVALLTLMLGIGATSAIFSVVDAVLLRPLPYREPSRLVSIFEDLSQMGFAHNTPAPGNYTAWKTRSHVFEDVAAVRDQVYNLSGSGTEPKKLEGEAVTQNLFSVLGVRPVVGRVFSPEEDRPGAARVVLISHRLWKSAFGGDIRVVGTQIHLNGETYSVVGVLPRGFSYPRGEVEVWVPLRFTPEDLANFGAHYLNVVGRLRPAVTLEQANAELAVVLKQVAREHPDTNSIIKRFFAEPLQDTYTRDVRRGLTVLFGAVGCILLIACGNIANLLLSRAGSRRREIAVRTALGADRMRVIRQLLTESLLLAAGGGALGLVTANWTLGFLSRLIPDTLSQTVSVELDLRVLLFSAAATLASSFLFGLAPALQISKVDLNDVLKEGGRGAVGSRKRGLGSLLVMGEVALSLILLVGAGILLQSFARIRGLDPGFRSDHVLTARIVVPETKYREFSRRSEMFTRILERVRALPGVKSAGFTSALPLTWEGGTSGVIPEGVVLKRGQAYDANNRVVSPGYFEAMGIPLREGRLFDDRDTSEAPPVAIINEAMARKFWPHQDPLGKRFKFGGDNNTPWIRIAGVVGNVRQMRLNEPPRQEMYFPYLQAENNWMVPRDLVVRTESDPASLASGIRQSVWSIDPDQPVSNVMTLDDLLDTEVAQRRTQSTLLGGLAALALVLACVGIYGVLSYLVTRRTQEIGVRVALGATRADIFRDVAGEGMVLSGTGIVLGVGGSLMLSQLLNSLVFGIHAIDPATYLAAVAIFAVLALLACSIPALRAVKTDAVEALRHE
jgi:putative ABC transport system permease protein